MKKTPETGDEVADCYGRIKCVAYLDKWVVCRRRGGRRPFVLSLREWYTLRDAAEPWMFEAGLLGVTRAPNPEAP